MGNQTDPLLQIAYRRDILDWRDRWIKKIESHFENEIYVLFNRLDVTIDEMGFTDLVRSKGFVTTRIEPVYNGWLTSQINLLSRDAQRDLNKIQQHAIESSAFTAEEFTGTDGSAFIGSVASGGVLAASAAGAGIVASHSVATVSVGGLLGFFGVTTTAVAWPVVLVGGATVAALAGFGVFKGAGVKSKAIQNFKSKYRDSVRERVFLGTKDNSSIVDRVQETIEKASSQLLAEKFFGH